MKVTKYLQGFRFSSPGFTLLEVLIAASILAVLAVSVIGVLLDDAQIDRIRKEKRFALLAAQEKMENLLLMDTSSLPSQNGTKFDVVGASEVVYKDIGSVTVVDQGTYYDITVTINTPNGVNFNMDVTLQSRKAKPK